MRKVVVMNRVSLDGFFTGPKGEIDWFIHDPEIDQALHEAGPDAIPADTVLFGRITYQMFEAHWPKAAVDPNAPEGERATGRELNAMTKVVFSRTLKEVTWVNSRLVKSEPAEEVRKLKQGTGNTMIIFGSGSIAQQLAAEGLIDEYLLIVTPVALGAGKLMFEGVNRLELKLVEARGFKSGNVLLHYQSNV